MCSSDLVAEAPEGYHGVDPATMTSEETFRQLSVVQVLAIGAALSSGDGKAAAKYSYNPQIPLLFLTPMNDGTSHRAIQVYALTEAWQRALQRSM